MRLAGGPQPTIKRKPHPLEDVPVRATWLRLAAALIATAVSIVSGQRARPTSTCGRNRSRPCGGDHVHGQGLLEYVSDRAVRLRQRQRRRSLSFARRFRDIGRSGSRARLRRRPRSAAGSTGRVPPAFRIRGPRQFPGVRETAIGGGGCA